MASSLSSNTRALMFCGTLASLDFLPIFKSFLITPGACNQPILTSGSIIDTICQMTTTRKIIDLMRAIDKLEGKR